MVAEISLTGLALAFIPALIVIAIMVYWHSIAATALYATARMLVQLLLIGYVLVYIFESDNWLVIFGVLAVMLFASSWIATRTLDSRTTLLFLQAMGSIAIGGFLTLALVTQFVLRVEPWFSPRYVVPLAGMILSSSMNAVSLAAERFQAESARDVSYPEARRTALQAALIPNINSLFAVGVVALPGMMTGQILSGVSPLIAAQYQIMVMTMIFGSSGISASCYLALQRRAAG
jgi:putative ABC transport system permease protein